MTFILLQIVRLITRGLREKAEDLEIGDVAIHDEEAYPEERFAERVGAFEMAGLTVGDPSPPSGMDAP
jgi:hypothetical protein